VGVLRRSPKRAPAAGHEVLSLPNWTLTQIF